MDILDEAKLKMDKSTESLESNLATLRTGRANAALLENLYCGTQKENIQDCFVNNHRVGRINKLIVYDKKIMLY